MTPPLTGPFTRFVVAAIVTYGTACGTAHSSSRSIAMTDLRETNKQNIKRLFETFNQGELSLVDTLVAPEYVGPQGDKGPAGFKAVIGGLRAAFPDLHYTVDEALAEDDLVAVRWHWTGTHQGPFRAFPATGKAVTNTGAGIFRLKDGKIVSADLETDRLGFLEQMGAVPANVGRGPTRSPTSPHP
jgi:steroid delta-isomerase-like uncharacterized protein